MNRRPGSPVSSARTFSKTSRKCRLFTLFCGLNDDAARRGGGPYLDFYLLCLRCISPSDIVALFKEPPEVGKVVLTLQSVDARLLEGAMVSHIVYKKKHVTKNTHVIRKYW